MSITLGVKWIQKCVFRDECLDIHVVPIGDTMDHYLTLTCPCKPDIKILRNSAIVVHVPEDPKFIINEGLNDAGIE